jgi:hypothetical protein
MLRVETENLRSWMSLFRTTRGSVSILVVVGLALVLPDQTGDELVALADMKVGPVPGLFVLQFALGFLSVTSWFWARAALAARFGVDDALESRHGLRHTHRKAFNAVPRLAFLFGVLLSLLLVWRSPSWTQALAVASWSVPAYLLIRWRLALTPACNRSQHVNMAVLRSRRQVRRWLKVIFPRLWALLALAPFGPWVSIPLFAVGLAAFLWGSVEGYVPWAEDYPGIASYATRVFPGPSVALIGCALVIGPLTALIFIMDGLRLETIILGRVVGLSRPPVITGLLAAILLAPYFFSLHPVRVLPPDKRTLAVDQRISLADMFQAWAAACAPDPSLPARPIVVAISGGASRAGVWGAQVLAAVDAAAGQRNAAVFAVSSVSGGSLGAAAYMAVMKATGAQCRRAESDYSHVRAMLDKVNNEKLGGDALGPLLAGGLLSDTPRALFAPVAALVRLAFGVQPHGGDRAEALERAFESLWSADLQRAGLADAGIPPFSDGFLSLFYQDGKPRPGMPIWIVNGTDLTTGDRMLTTPLSSGSDAPWPFRATNDVLGVLQADVPISTAINNGARFPFLEPPGELIAQSDKDSQMRHGQPELLDGGYFDNEGLQTALELAEWLKLQTWHGQPVQPVIVQATANADIDAELKAAVVRCPNQPLDVPTNLPPTEKLLEVAAPVVGLYNVGGAHAAVLLREVRDRYCGHGSPNAFFHFYLFNSPDRDIPLNWLLSPEIVATIRAQLSAGGVGPAADRNSNDTEYQSLFDTLHGKAESSGEAKASPPPEPLRTSKPAFPSR